MYENLLVRFSFFFHILLKKKKYIMRKMCIFHEAINNNLDKLIFNKCEMQLINKIIESWYTR